MQKFGVLKIFLFYWILFLTTFSVWSQSNSIEFDKYSTNDGLSNGYISSIYQDSRGFVWIGTSNGLNRFDGITFKTYYSDKKDSTTLPSSGINSIIEDSLGNIWIATFNGLCLYNSRNDNFIRKNTLVNKTIQIDFSTTGLFLDQMGFLWISTYFGILRIEPGKNVTKSNTINAEIFLLDEYDIEDTYFYNSVKITEDNNGNIWAASSSSHIFLFNKDKQLFTPYLINHPEVSSFVNKAKSIIVDSDGDFFISIEECGLLMWNRKKDEFKLFKPDGTNKTPKGSILNPICEDKNGMIWIGDRYSEGISIFNKKTGEFTYCQQEDANPYSLLTNKINTIYCDRNGIMWIGTIIGMNKYSPGKSKFNRYFSIFDRKDKLSSNNILCFEESKNGNIWIGTDGGGLNMLDRKSGKFTQYQHNPSKPNSISSNAITSICEDHEGTVWMGTYNGGLAKMKGGKFFAYFPENGNPYSISNQHVWYVYEDSKKNLWVATLNSGLELFDRESNRFYHYTRNKNDSTSLCNNALFGIFEDSKQNLYITSYRGVSVVDLKNYDFSKLPPTILFKNLTHYENRNSISNNNVYCVNEDRDGNLWFGTLGSGIDKMDRVTGKFNNYSTKDGLPGNSIKSILFDEEDNLWLGTDNGLAKFNPNTKEIVVFDRMDGLLNKNIISWSTKTKDGEMFFGGPDGFNSFYPEQVKSIINQRKPNIIITQLKIFNTPVATNQKINNRTILKSDISTIHELNLTYKENFFTFEFVALDFTTPEKNKYAYIMEGFDNDWIQCGSKREANYTNLDPGTYTFRVKASNNDGVWNDEGTSLLIHISPPWWETWLFRIVVLLSIISGITIFVFYRISYFKNQKIQLEKLVDKKTSELQQANNELIKRTHDLIRSNELLEIRQEEIEAQSEELSAQKYALEEMNRELNELNATKDKFFSIIAHDIKAPFNSILGFSELLVENFNEWSDKVKLDTLQIVLSSSQNLITLLENLLQWSRSQRGTIEFNPEKIELEKTFLKVIELMNGNSEAKKIKLTMSLPEGGIAVFADQLMLDTIMRNLVGNAIKFTKAHGNIRIVAQENSGFAKIEVIDDGVGIKSEIADRLFSISTNHSTPGTNNETGTGLGLVITHDFVLRHGGEIKINSIIDKGSNFNFTLPLAK
jgi:signal transduction histidine kinase/ligand-binding sensor domain-containing protein